LFILLQYIKLASVLATAVLKLKPLDAIPLLKNPPVAAHILSINESQRPSTGCKALHQPVPCCLSALISVLVPTSPVSSLTVLKQQV
jgi:hypothetical protein